MRNQLQITANFNHSFGSSMMGYSNKEFLYSFGMNTQEKEDDVFEGAYSAEYWMYDSRLGRRWNVDPVVKAHESPYAAFGNNPIWFVDHNGADTSVSVTTSATQDVYSSTTSSSTSSDEKLDENDDRFKDALKSNKDAFNPVPNSPHVSYSNIRIETTNTVTNHTTTTVTYNSDGTRTEKTVMTSTITTTKRILFDVSNNLGNKNMAYPVTNKGSVVLGSSTTPSQIKTINTPMYMKTFVDAGVSERSNSKAGNIRTLNSISGYEGDIEYHSRVVGYTAGSGIIITGIGKKAKNPYVKGVTQIVGGTLIIIGQVAETGMISYVWLHNTYSIPYNKKNWTYRGGAIVPNANR